MVELLVLALATTRLLFLWFTQDIFKWPRTKLGQLNGWVDYLVNCPICMSVWVGAGVYGVWLWQSWVVWALALSALAGPLHRLLTLVEIYQPGSNAPDSLADRVAALRK